MIDDGQQLDLEATPFRASRSRRRTAAWVLLICGGLPALTTFMGFLGLFWWPCDILANFRFQYALILSGVIIAAMFSKRYLWAVLLCLPLALNVALIVPLFITSQSQQEAKIYILPTSRKSPLKNIQTIMNVQPQVLSIRMKRPNTCLMKCSGMSMVNHSPSSI